MTNAYNVARQQYQRFLDPKLIGQGGKQEEIRTTPLFSLAVKYAVDHHTADQSSVIDEHLEDQPSDPSCSNPGSEPSTDAECDRPASPASDNNGSNEQGTVLPEYALLGFSIGNKAEITTCEPLLMNVNAPNSAFICGSQGSGKSYTLSCMLENCLRHDPAIGNVSSPVAGVVFHYDIDSTGSVAEAAYLCSRGIKVNVLVSPSNEYALRAAYQQIPGSGKSLNVRTLHLQSADLSIERIHKLMAFSEKEGSVPLYMEVAQRILREMAVSSRGAPFNYKHFKAKIAQESFSRDQSSPLNLRLNLLESFMDLTKAKSAFQLQPGTLTIVDLSDPFIDASTVCVLFDICLSLIKERRPSAGLAVALDEAHKYMGKSAAATNFTDRLLTTIREQRHNATRVFVATQEPTISEKLLDLCSVAIVHRFTSPAWFAAIKDHLGGASTMIRAAREEKEEADGDEALKDMSVFERIVDLQVGESLVFAPSAYLQMGSDGTPKKMGAVAIKMKTRMREGADGGTSVLALR